MNAIVKTASGHTDNNKMEERKKKRSTSSGLTKKKNGTIPIFNFPSEPLFSVEPLAIVLRLLKRTKRTS